MKIHQDCKVPAFDDKFLRCHDLLISTWGTEPFERAESRKLCRLLGAVMCFYTFSVLVVCTDRIHVGPVRFPVTAAAFLCGSCRQTPEKGCAWSCACAFPPRRAKVVALWWMVGCCARAFSGFWWRRRPGREVQLLVGRCTNVYRLWAFRISGESTKFWLLWYL